MLALKLKRLRQRLVGAWRRVGRCGRSCQLRALPGEALPVTLNDGFAQIVRLSIGQRGQILQDDLAKLAKLVEARPVLDVVYESAGQLDGLEQPPDIVLFTRRQLPYFACLIRLFEKAVELGADRPAHVQIVQHLINLKWQVLLIVYFFTWQTPGRPVQRAPFFPFQLHGELRLIKHKMQIIHIQLRDDFMRQPQGFVVGRVWPRPVLARPAIKQGPARGHGGNAKQKRRFLFP